MRTGTAHLPLHGGQAPRWLFSRMVALSREIVRVLAEEYGPTEILRRISDPHWFQAFGCVLGFDWHSSGLTTTTTGALKEAVKGREADLGLFVAGGKGAVSRKTPSEILLASEHHAMARPAKELVYASKLAAKVDNTALQDGYQLYHHAFLFTPGGEWAVVQQGMSDETKYARRYHWLSTEVEDFVNEPHAAVVADKRGQLILNMVAQESEAARRTSALLAAEPPRKLVQELQRAQELGGFGTKEVPKHHADTGQLPGLEMPRRHEVQLTDIRPESLERTLLKTYEHPPEGFEELLSRPGVGPKTIRALALLSDLIYGVKASHRDPAKYSFAHGGKDGTPFPVDRETYDRSIHVLREAVNRAKIADREKLEAIRRLARQQGEVGTIDEHI